MIRTRRAQESKSSGGAAALIGLIGLFLVLYVLFLPADLRQELLDDNITPYGENPNTTIIENNAVWSSILTESPGRLDVLDVTNCIAKECSHEISSFVLFKTTDSEVLDSYNPFIIKNNIMTKKFNSVNFDIMDLEHTENTFLTFTSYEHRGLLTIKLNGNIIYEKEIDSFNPTPIELPKDMLARTNKLDFEVSQVGWEFWKTNTYKIENMKIIGDVTDVSKQKTSNTFYVTESEYDNTERARLKFSPDCNQGQVGLLEIMLNSRQLYSGIPDCKALNVIEFPPTSLENGENNLVFKTEKGSYLVDLVEVRTDLKDVKYPVYYFDLDQDELNWIKDKDANLTASLEFVSENVQGINDPDYEVNTEDKKYSVIMTVNGHKKYIDTYDENFDTQISYDILRKSDNWIKLEPRGSMIDIASLKIEVVPDNTN